MALFIVEFDLQDRKKDLCVNYHLSFFYYLYFLLSVILKDLSCNT